MTSSLMAHIHLLTVLLTSLFKCKIVHSVSPVSMINGTMIQYQRVKENYCVVLIITEPQV